ncbi:MAG: bifunctional 4-hydroxy-2-oxoglutarate aldolase/2-dehydro-3-deoxy-phosphogluconate aldolase [Spirochaetia bacterium]
MKVLHVLEEAGIVPVIKISDPVLAPRLGETLFQAGLPAAEITFRTKAASESMRKMKDRCPELTVGAGTVLTPEQVTQAYQSGADFLVSPGLNQNVVHAAQEVGLPIFPGVDSPTAIEQALQLGIKVMKFFPAQQSGGTGFLKAMKGPYPDVTFFPTGGINQENLIDYLRLPNVIACGGSWVVPQDLLSRGNFAEIEKTAADAYITALGLKTVGFTPPSDVASELFQVFSSVLSKKDVLENSGEVLLQVNSLARMEKRLTRQGISFEKSDEEINLILPGFSIRVIGPEK